MSASELSEWIAAKSAHAIDPERVRIALASIAEAWPPEYTPLPDVLASFPAGEAALLHLFAVSPVSAEKCVKDPGALLWLSDPAVSMSSRGPGRMRAELAKLDAASMPPSSAKKPFDPAFRNLRRVKNRETLRLALRDVANLAPVEEITAELSLIAELCMREVTDGWLNELAVRWGRPQTDFAVFAMGKFGGQDLNYSSDIDVIFLYDAEGYLNSNFTYHDFFTRLCEKIVATFSASDPAGALFRIDLRLRPEGAPGPLVRSLESTENYYAGHGETWERMALIKCRGVAGSAELGYEVPQRLQPFIFPRTLSPDVFEEISSIKARIERDIVGEADLHRNVKLGYGGIREIEFVIQTFQLIHGARNAFLQERNTLKALAGLEKLRLLPKDDATVLANAYRFLRRVEHRLQIEHEAQTHTLPARPDAIARLAVSLNFSTAEAFQAELTRHTREVRTIFDRTLRAPSSEPNGPPPERDLSFFAHPPDAAKMLGDLATGESNGHVAPRTRRLYGKLEPVLLGALRPMADPDVALARFVRFVEKYGIRSLLFEALVVHPRLLELLVRLFDSSRFMTDIVLRRPGLIEEIAREGLLGQRFGVPEYLTGLARNLENLPWQDWVRAYRRSQILRIFLRDVLSFASIEEVHAEYSALAEACVAFEHRQLGVADRFAVVAMGKFGGRELSYGCDLDVVFVGNDPDAAARLIKSMTGTTAEGIVFPVDARLRPEGVAGVLAIPVSAFEEYFQERAQFWEAQALTKSRPISGPPELQAAFAEFAQRTWRRFGAQPDAVQQIKAMHARVVKERAAGDDLPDFKTGRGGLMEAEFCIQAMQMRHGIWKQNTVAAMEALRSNGILADAQAASLRSSYLFLRRVEAVIRRVENSSVSTLPAHETEQRQVAIRLGYANREEFLARYSEARAAVHEAVSALW